MNDQNFEFFEATDGFFTDYHWKLENLKVTLDSYNALIGRDRLSTYDIFIGNDTYGRGTYGGGRLDIHRAISEILKYPFSIALFGQALWYEQYQGCTDLNIFHINEDLFWRGRNLKLLADSSGKLYSRPDQPKILSKKDKFLKDWNLNGDLDADWKIIDKGGDAFSTVSCYKWCTKFLVIDMQELLSICVDEI